MRATWLFLLLPTLLPLLPGGSVGGAEPARDLSATGPATAPATRGAPDTATFGDARGAKRITFAVDVSGSMGNKWSSLKSEVERALAGLRPDQSFNLVLFEFGGHVDVLSRDGFVPPTAENKRRAHVLLGDASPGLSDPLKGLALAFRQQPDLIYLVTDGDFLNNDAVARRVAELNPDRRVRVNTVAFVSEENTDTDFLRLLRQLARDHGGTFRLVKEEALLDDPPAIAPAPPATRPASGPATRRVAAPPATAPAGAAAAPPFGRLHGAGRVVFVIDGTGTLLNRFTTLRHELMAALGDLGPDQSFNIVFLSGGRGGACLVADEPLSATPDGRVKAAAFLRDVQFGAASDPFPGIDAAFRQRPDVVVLLTDGNFPDNDAVARRFRDRNPGRKVRVNTVVLPSDPVADGEIIAVMHRIAADGGGSFRLWKDED